MRWMSLILLLLIITINVSAQNVTYTSISSNVCVVIGDYTEVDCSILPPEQQPGTTTPYPCPGLLDPSTPRATYLGHRDPCYIPPSTPSIPLNGSQIVYASFEDALAQCPFNPVYIEIVGTVYISASAANLNFWYNQTKDLIINGITQETTSAPINVTTQVLQNVTYFNATSNTSIIVEEYVNVTTLQNGTQTNVSSVLVGFKNLQVKYQNISIVIANIVLDGCYSNNSVFLTESCMDRCTFDEPIGYCPGYYFQYSVAQAIYNAGICQRTGAMFDGRRAVSVGPLGDPSFENQNTATPTTQVSSFQFISQLTLEMWIFINFDMTFYAGSAGNLRAVDSDSSGYGWIWSPNSTTPMMKWCVSDGNGVMFCIPLEVGLFQWTHLAGTFFNGTLSVYLNGIFQGSSDIGMDHVGYRYNRLFSIGQSDTGDLTNRAYFNGTVDEVRVWNYARSPVEIFGNYSNIMSPSEPGLIGYWRFDEPLGTEADYYLHNLVAISQSNPALDSQLYVNPNDSGGYSGDPYPIPDCFCVEYTGLCVPTELDLIPPPDSIDSTIDELCPGQCEFINGVLIEPNDIYGVLWLPGVINVTGPFYEPVNVIIPGEYFDMGGKLVFVPGATPNILPPVGPDSNNPYYNQTGFLSGWFSNGGQAPFTWFNFFPGVFLNLTSPANEYQNCSNVVNSTNVTVCVNVTTLINSTNVTTLNCTETISYFNSSSCVPQNIFNQTTNCSSSYLTFVPGIQWNNGNFTPFSPMNPMYLLSRLIIGDLCFNPDTDISNCITPPDPAIGTPSNGPIEESIFGCQIGGNITAPAYFNASARDPCSILSSLRALTPTDSHHLPISVLLDCKFGPNDIEPTYLDPTQRDPCWVLKDLLEAPPGQNCTQQGGVYVPPLYMPCLKNQNLTMINSIVTRYYADRVVCQYACDEFVTLRMHDTHFVNIPSTALWSSGLEHYDVHDNTFCPCGGCNEQCVYLNANHVSSGQFTFYNNRHCAVSDDLPVECDYDITTTLRCHDGVLFCMDVGATILGGCQQVEVSPGVVLYDSDCAVYVPCTCGSENTTVTLSNGFEMNVTLFNQPITLQLEFYTPVLAQFIGNDGILSIPCPITNSSLTTSSVCLEIVVIPVNTTVVYNSTTNITVIINVTTAMFLPCTANATVANHTGNLTCPCPAGFNPNNTLGSAIGSQASANQNCSWPIPGGPPGEICLNSVVQCPYAGGTFGSANPPPTPPNLCYNGMATLTCNNMTCVNGSITFEYINYPCDLNTNPNGTCATQGILEVACMCEKPGIITSPIQCQRNVTCFESTPCPANDTLCANNCTYIYGDVSFLCQISANQTMCDVCAFNTNLTTNLTQGDVVLGCSDYWIPPPPGPCTCNYQSNQTACPANASLTNSTGNCTFQTAIQINTGDPTLQLYCNPDGTVSCRCNGFQAVNLSLPCGAVNPNATAFVLDHRPDQSRLSYDQGNVAQQLPYGMAINRYSWDLIRRFPLKVNHWFTEQGVIHELSRINTLITGTVHDWRYGYLSQWNVVFCDSGCHQNRPKELTEACVVDQTYNGATPRFFSVTFNSINDAIFNCIYPSIVVHKGQHVYEEVIYYQPSQNNHWLGSYDGAIVVAAGHTIAADNITFRGLTFVHPRDTTAPIITLTPTNYALFNIPNLFQITAPPTNFTVMNCVFRGQASSDTGAIVGQETNTVLINYNTFESFQVRTIDLVCDFFIGRLNTFLSIGGRALRLRSVQGFTVELNNFYGCTGITEAVDVDMIHIEIVGSQNQVASFGTPTTVNTNSIKYAQLFNTQGGLTQDIFAPPTNINPGDLGCNPTNNPLQVCYLRGNIHSNPSTYRDQSFALYHILGGNYTIDSVVDNTGNFGKYCMIISFNPSITPLQGSELYKRNALCRTYFTRQLADGADFAFQLYASPIYYTCSFPNCLSFNETYPPLQVNPRHQLTLVPYYGFWYINNLTDCATFSLTLNMCNVTTERAIIRRENIQFWLASYMSGCDYCSFCCAKPIIRGGQHFIGNDTLVLEKLNFRYEFSPSIAQDATELIISQRELDMQLIYFKELDFDGQGLRAIQRARVIDIIMGEFASSFSLVDCNFFNWYNFPNGTFIAGIEDPRGVVPVIVLPDSSIFFTQRAPSFTGIFIQFAPLKTLNTVQYALPIPVTIEPIDFISLGVLASNPPGNVNPLTQNNKPLNDPSVIQREQLPFISPPNSKAYIVGNVFHDFDGKVIDLIRPANLYMVNNTFDNCGMRQPNQIAVINIEGHPDSYGQYFMKNNTMWQYKTALFPVGGGKGNFVKVAGWYIHNFGDPVVFVFDNNTVILNVNYTCLNITKKNTGLFGTNFDLKPFYINAGDTKYNIGAFVSSSGFNFLGWDTLDPNTIAPLSLQASDITGTSLSPAISNGMTDFGQTNNDPNLNLDGSNAYQAKSPYASGVNDNSYVQYQRIQHSQNVQLQVSKFANEFGFPDCMTGYSIAVRFDSISGKTMLLTRSSDKIAEPILGYQMSLYPLRVIAGQNFQDTQSLIAAGVYTIDTLPFNGPGLQGAISDLVYCHGYSDITNKKMKSCAICNDGCPVVNPPSCIVDRDNSTFVPSNPYFNSWLFTSINTAVLKCQDPNRRINVVYQASGPYKELFNLQGPGNVTIFSSTGAVLLIKGNSFIINTHTITFNNLTFIHGVGDNNPTIIPGSNILTTAPENITFNNCTFEGYQTLAPAFSGTFESISILYSFFFDYNGPRIVNISSNCGMAFVESCLFNYAAGAAIAILDADIAVVSRNVLEDCGGNAVNELACVFVRMCTLSELQIVISGNVQTQTGPVNYPRTGICNGHVASYWLDGLDLAAPNVTHVDLSSNYGSGLPVGFRVSNMTGLKSTFTADYRAYPQWIYIYNLNFHVFGTWHNIVVGWPCIDNQIDTEPIISASYYCDATCEGSSQGILKILIISILVAVLIVWFVITYYFRTPVPPPMPYEYPEAFPKGYRHGETLDDNVNTIFDRKLLDRRYDGEKDD